MYVLSQYIGINYIGCPGTNGQFHICHFIFIIVN